MIKLDGMMSCERRGAPSSASQRRPMHMVYLEKPVPDTLLSGVSGAVLTVQNITDIPFILDYCYFSLLRSLVTSKNPPQSFTIDFLKVQDVL
jgi:hypothetical protein